MNSVVAPSGLLANLFPLLPEIYLALCAAALLLLGIYRHARVSQGLVLSTVLVLVLTLFVLSRTGAGPALVMNGMFIADGYAMFVKALILGAAILTLLISAGWLSEEGGRPFEFLLLLLFSTLGMMCMVSAGSLLSVYMALELSSLPLYVLASFNRDHVRSTEAGLKYFVLGALASGMMLFGMSLVYGFTGALSFDTLATALAGFTDEAGGDPAAARAVTLGMVFIIIGFCFKISAVPFHMWAPDVYEGAPTPVTAFFAMAPKVAAMALFARVLMQPFGDLQPQWQQVIAFVSIASMAVGALVALRQTNIKRLLAYSSIGHAGFMLMGVVSGSTSGLQGMLIYLAVYIVTSAGAWGCVLLMKRGGEYVEEVADLAGLSRRSPWLAFSLAACMFSMAGIPPLAGFFGKMYVILPAIEAGLVWLAVAGLVASVISCYYYLRVVKFMYFDEPAEPFDAGMTAAMRIGLGVSIAAVTLLFLVPGPLVVHARQAATLLLR